jgi:hypothetical protein
MIWLVEEYCIEIADGVIYMITNIEMKNWYYADDTPFIKIKVLFHSLLLLRSN